MDHTTAAGKAPASSFEISERVEQVAARRHPLGALRDGVGASLGAILGLAPHLLHHIGLIAGAALVTGAFGNVLLFSVGLVFSIPLLRRLHRRFRTWRAPAIAVAGFIAVFSLSAFVIGPAITGGDEGGPAIPNPPPSLSHSGHHG